MHYAFRKDEDSVRADGRLYIIYAKQKTPSANFIISAVANHVGVVPNYHNLPRIKMGLHHRSDGILVLFLDYRLAHSWLKLELFQKCLE